MDTGLPRCRGGHATRPLVRSCVRRLFVSQTQTNDQQTPTAEGGHTPHVWTTDATTYLKYTNQQLHIFIQTSLKLFLSSTVHSIYIFCFEACPIYEVPDSRFEICLQVPLFCQLTFSFAAFHKLTVLVSLPGRSNLKCPNCR